MRLLLNEMWNPAIASELRRRGFDVAAINEPERAERYAGTEDALVFARAQQDRWTIVTDNVADYERARRDWEARGASHFGVVYALDPPFNRHRAESVVGLMVEALAALLATAGAEIDPRGRVHYLRVAHAADSD
jgi:hypothetical protein